MYNIQFSNLLQQTKALWNHYDDSASPKFIQQRQVMHVGILSCGNFIGRLSSGTPLPPR